MTYDIQSLESALRFYWKELKRNDLPPNIKTAYTDISRQIVEYYIEERPVEYHAFVMDYHKKEGALCAES